MVKQTSKDGKIKSKDFNLFAQFENKKKEKAASHKSSSDDPDGDQASDANDNVSEKLKKTIEESINSYSLEKASNDKGEKP